VLTVYSNYTTHVYVYLEVRYVSELQTSNGQFFILQVIYEHGKPWWNGIDRIIKSEELGENLS
jgi:hypothetical protein